MSSAEGMTRQQKKDYFSVSPPRGPRASKMRALGGLGKRKRSDDDDDDDGATPAKEKMPLARTKISNPSVSAAQPTSKRRRVSAVPSPSKKTQKQQQQQQQQQQKQQQQQRQGKVDDESESESEDDESELAMNGVELVYGTLKQRKRRRERENRALDRSLGGADCDSEQEEDYDDDDVDTDDENERREKREYRRAMRMYRLASAQLDCAMKRAMFIEKIFHLEETSKESFGDPYEKCTYAEDPLTGDLRIVGEHAVFSGSFMQMKARRMIAGLHQLEEKTSAPFVSPYISTKAAELARACWTVRDRVKHLSLDPFLGTNSAEQRRTIIAISRAATTRIRAKTGREPMRTLMTINGKQCSVCAYPVGIELDILDEVIREKCKPAPRTQREREEDEKREQARSTQDKVIEVSDGDEDSDSDVSVWDGDFSDDYDDDDDESELEAFPRLTSGTCAENHMRKGVDTFIDSPIAAPDSIPDQNAGGAKERARTFLTSMYAPTETMSAPPPVVYARGSSADSDL